MKTIMGMVHPFRGEVLFEGRAIHHCSPAEVVRAGIAPVLESRRIFPELTIYENLLMGAYTRSDGEEIQKDIEKTYELFPVLHERRRQQGGTLSGGEQQMLAMGRAMMSRPKLLMLDEPSMGLSPLMMKKIMQTVKTLQSQGTTILLVEQNAQAALSLADHGYVLEVGKIVLQGTGKDLMVNDAVRKAYLGED
jgi:branched-chain amino acid transport system ATP-binding protein